MNTKLKDAKISIELQEKFYKNIMEKIKTGIMSFDKSGVVEFTNPEIKTDVQAGSDFAYQ